ncbi:MAG: zinc-dependent alcohol dehydrogenase [Fidelibacterota bacterium]
MRKDCRKILVNKEWDINFVTDKFKEKIDNPYEIIVKNKYTHISAGTELACISGLESWFPFPGTPGYTAIGEIIEKGDEVRDFEIGDLVFTMSNHAEYFKLDIRDRWHGVCVKLPAGIDPEHAAFVHMGIIAITSLRVSEIELGDNVLVTGLGVIGNMAAQFARMQGANVIATDIIDERIKVAKQCGIKTAINSKKVDLKKEIDKVTNGESVSTFIDATGVPALIEQYADFVAFNGEIVLLGSPRAEYETNLTNLLQKVHLLPQNLKLKGALEFTFPTQQDEFVKHSIERNAKIILNLINEDKLKIEPFYTQKITPQEAPQAYVGLRDKGEEYMGVVIDWN